MVFAPKTIIWDLDGTLINSFELYRELVTLSLEKRGLAIPSKQEFIRNNHGSLEDSIIGVTGISDAQEVQAILSEFLDLQRERYSRIDDLFYSDAVALAQKAHQLGVKQLLVTNREHTDRGPASPRFIVANSQISHIISDVIAGDDHAFNKPDIRLLQTLEGYDFSKDVLVIGDTFVDAELARNAHAQAVLVQRHDEIPHLERLGDNWQAYIHVVDSLDEIELTVL